jgi:hypothetical protein
MRPNLLMVPNCTRARSWRRLAQAVFHFAAVLRIFHVDEVDHDQATQIAQAHLAGHFVGGFRLVRVAVSSMSPPLMARAEFTSTDTRLRCGRSRWRRPKAVARCVRRRFDLVFDLEAAEQRCIVAVALHAAACSGMTCCMNCCACS